MTEGVIIHTWQTLPATNCFSMAEQAAKYYEQKK